MVFYCSKTVFRPVDIENMMVLDYSSAEDCIRYPHMGGKLLLQAEAI